MAASVCKVRAVLLQVCSLLGIPWNSVKSKTDSVGLRYNPRFCISKMLTVDAEAANPGTILPEVKKGVKHRKRSDPCCCEADHLSGETNNK